MGGWFSNSDWLQHRSCVLLHLFCVQPVLLRPDKQGQAQDEKRWRRLKRDAPRDHGKRALDRSLPSRPRKGAQREELVLLCTRHDCTLGSWSRLSKLRLCSFPRIFIGGFAFSHGCSGGDKEDSICVEARKPFFLLG